METSRIEPRPRPQPAAERRRRRQRRQRPGREFGELLAAGPGTGEEHPRTESAARAEPAPREEDRTIGGQLDVIA